MPFQLCIYDQGEPADEDLTLLVPGLTILTALPLMLAFFLFKSKISPLKGSSCCGSMEESCFHSS